MKTRQDNSAHNRWLLQIVQRFPSCIFSSTELSSR